MVVQYKALIPSENVDVAVKKFSKYEIKSKDDFLAELTIINRLRHRNLVKLLGWCHQNGMLLLVYEYMSNGSLDKHIFSDDSLTPLSWELRYKALKGVASALHYLHYEYDDFGLARAVDHEKTSYAEMECVHGTMGLSHEAQLGISRKGMSADFPKILKERQIIQQPP